MTAQSQSMNETGVISSEPAPDRKPRYLVRKRGVWCFMPSDEMKARGFFYIQFGTVLTKEAIDRVLGLTREWDEMRNGSAATRETPCPERRLEWGYKKILALHTKEREARGRPITPQEAKWGDWARFWQFARPKFGQRDPRSITQDELFELQQHVRATVGDHDAHNLIKIWRALWRRMGTLRCADGGLLCDKVADPSTAFANPAPKGRTQIWLALEVRTFVERAWERGYYGLAAAVAVAWDTQFSPVDVCSLTPNHIKADGPGNFCFFKPRAKTDEPAYGTFISEWIIDGQRITTAALIRLYVSKLGATLLPTTPIFWTRGNARAGSFPGSHRGSHATIKPRPYTRSTLGHDFYDVRALVFGKDEKRQIRDMRRSGTVEAFAGDARPEHVREKMANTISHSNVLYQTYNPVDREKVRAADEARLIGRERLAAAVETNVSGLDLLMARPLPIVTSDVT